MSSGRWARPDGLQRALQALAGPVLLRRAIWLAAVSVVLVGWSAPDDVLAADFVVTMTADLSDLNAGNGACDVSAAPGDQCTLRAAIQEANALGGGPHTIILPGGHYTLTRTGAADDTALNGDLDVTAAIAILGAGPAATIVQACDADALPTCTGIDRVFHVLGSGQLTLNAVTVRKGNTSGSGGGIVNQGQLTLTNSVLDDNRASGGVGGGLLNSEATANATVTNVTISNNRATEGGGVQNVNGAILALTNVTISDNTATTINGGGLAQVGGGAPGAILTNVTIFKNQSPGAGGGIFASTGQVTLRNTIIADNLDATRPANCQAISPGSFTSQGFNLVHPGAECGLATGTKDLLNLDPKLGPLQDNAGPVPTRALLPGSPAIDAGNPATPLDGLNGRCAGADARGVPRGTDGNLDTFGVCDIGAYELPSFNVNTTADLDDAVPGNLVCATGVSGQCSLRAAIREANAQGAGAIKLPQGAFTLTRQGDDDTAENGDLDILGGITIVGLGSGSTVIRGCDADANPACFGSDRIFHVRPGATLILGSLTASHGSTAGVGGGINNQGTLTLTNVALDSNRTTNNPGGGLSNGGSPDAIATLANVAITNNQALRGGGGMVILDGAVDLTNVTISGNTAGGPGGAFEIGTITASPRASLNNVTIADNSSARISSPGGINGLAGIIRFSNTIIAGNRNGSGVSNCAGGADFISDGFNLVFPGTGCGFSAADNDVLDRDPVLDILRADGPGVPTNALLAGSAAIDAGNPQGPLNGQARHCTSQDARGASRQDGDGDGSVRCDIGAFEFFSASPDISVTLDDRATAPVPGATLSYQLQVAHVDGLIVPNIHLVAHFPAPLTNVSWRCDPSGASTCAPATGVGDIDAIIRLDAGVSVSYTVTATVARDATNGSTIGATAAITMPVGITDPGAGNNRASDVDTVTFTQCAPRPSVTHRVAPAGPGRVQVTLEAIKNTDQLGNALQSVRIGTLQNAVVDVPIQPGIPAAQAGLGSGALVTPSGPIASLQVFVRRVSGPGVAFTAPMTITDACGAWPTFAGGGASIR